MSSHIRAAVCLFVLAALVASAPAQDRDNGYSRHLREAEKKLEPTTLKTEQLIKLLQDEWFYNREAAVKELKRRGRPEHALVLDAWIGGQPETSWRAEEVLKSIRNDVYAEIAKTVKPKVTLKVTNPRFWSGTNTFAGGFPDHSLDSSIEMKSDHPLVKVTTPLMVKSGKTDKGEPIGSQVWARSDSGETCAALFLNRPGGEFSEVNATVIVKGAAKICDTLSEKFELGKQFDVRKDVLWLRIVQAEDKEGKKIEGSYVLDAIDVLGRLSAGELLLFDDKKQPFTATIDQGRGGFRRCWYITCDNVKTKPSSFTFRASGFEVPFEVEIDVKVPHPPK